jgi:hypothetical protein
MAKADKRLEKWLTNPPREAPIKEVLAMLERFFPGQYQKKKGSHIVCQDDRLKNHPECGPNGDFDIAVKGGQKVKGLYLGRLARIIVFLEELKEEQDE